MEERWEIEGTSGGLETSITPQSSSSKVKISLSLTYGYNTDTTYAIRIIRTIGGVSVPIMLGVGSNTAAVADNTTYTAEQNATFSLVTEDSAEIYHTETTSFTGIDEPNTTRYCYILYKLEVIMILIEKFVLTKVFQEEIIQMVILSILR